MLTLALLLGLLAGPTAAADVDERDLTTSTTDAPDSIAGPEPPVLTTTTEGPRSAPEDRDADLEALSATAVESGEVRVAVRVSDGVDPSNSVDAALAGTEHTIGSESDGVVGVTVDAEGLERLASTPEVTSIDEDIPLYPASTSPGQLAYGVRANVAHGISLQGEGRRIAVLDSGVDLGHPTFSGIDVIEACVVAAGPEACGNVGGPGTAAPCSVATLGCEHGTHVAGLAVGRGSAGVPYGIAPDADLVAIRVLSPDGAGAVTAHHTDIAAAIDRVLSIDAATPIDAVNLSLGSAGAYPGNGTCNTADGGLLQGKFAELNAAGIAVVVASGNYGAGSEGAYGLSYPSCVTGAIAVSGSNTSTNSLWIGANRNANIVIAAPAFEIAGAVPFGATGSPVKSGTSLATPQVSATVALLRQGEPTLPVSSIVPRLRATGSHLAGTSIRQLDVAAAIGGYWVVTSTGAVRPAGPLGTMPPSTGGAPSPGERYVAGAPNPSGLGYRLVTDSGRVSTYGNATFEGDMSGIPLNQPIVAMAATPSGDGYWLLAADGGIFNFGDAKFYGSTGNLRLNAPVTDMASTPNGDGYWLTAKDGGVFTFGRAQFYGSTGNMTLNQPVVSIAAHPTRGYWLVALDGGVFSFGGARFHGSLPGAGVATTTGSRVRATVGGNGYYITTRSGGVHAFGNAAPIAPRGLLPGEQMVDLMLPAIN